ncbi:MAG: protein translocase subunit SecF [Treponema sp.]|jgi:preprotein translocase subunit SecF|nr:protein translocase subunit SecF [Treponema sp.]
MRKTKNFAKFFLPAAIFSIALVAFGITGYIIKGFTLGVDFQAGLLQEVQFAPTAFNLRWSGTSNAILSFDRGSIYIVISGSGIENQTFAFPFSENPTLGALARNMKQQLEDLDITMLANERTNSQWLLFSSQGTPYLNNETPYIVHYLDPQSAPIGISEVRNAMAGFGQGVSVQSIGLPQDRHFMVRVEDEDEGRVQGGQIVQALESYFGAGEVAVLRSDYVGSRFSKDLTDQVGILMGLTLLLILLYVSFRFKPQLAVGAVVGIVHDAIIIVAFIVWTQMEFSTTTIAAILTILGYSINNTIVVFDRFRETRKLYPDNTFVDVLNISLTNVLGRTIITTVTTILAILFLFIFAKGSMKDFALALIVGLISGAYTTLFIASGFVNFWENVKIKQEKKKLVSE